MRPLRNVTSLFERDGVDYEVRIDDGDIVVYAPHEALFYEYRWPERVFHPWMWGKPLGTVVELAISRAHRSHLRKQARLRDLEELRRQLSSREKQRRSG